MFVFANQPGTTKSIVSEDGYTGFIFDWGTSTPDVRGIVAADITELRHGLHEYLKFNPQAWVISPNVTNVEGRYQPIEPEDTDDDTTDS